MCEYLLPVPREYTPITGNWAYYTLAIIWDGPKYPYQVGKELKELLGSDRELSDVAGQEVNRLASKGLIRPKTSVTVNGRKRLLYEITQEGIDSFLAANRW